MKLYLQRVLGEDERSQPKTLNCHKANSLMCDRLIDAQAKVIRREKHKNLRLDKLLIKRNIVSLMEPGKKTTTEERSS